ncbi:hypothetical protein FQN54_003845 [Arachnomyces sp. PD_36]|nr:hypothetical protein FQN54_003845 [Arachnomyces sp. PD_36]
MWVRFSAPLLSPLGRTRSQNPSSELFTQRGLTDLPYCALEHVLERNSKNSGNRRRNLLSDVFLLDNQCKSCSGASSGVTCGIHRALRIGSYREENGELVRLTERQKGVELASFEAGEEFGLFLCLSDRVPTSINSTQYRKTNFYDMCDVLLQFPNNNTRWSIFNFALHLAVLKYPRFDLQSYPQPLIRTTERTEDGLLANQSSIHEFCISPMRHNTQLMGSVNLMTETSECCQHLVSGLGTNDGSTSFARTYSALHSSLGLAPIARSKR